MNKNVIRETVLGSMNSTMNFAELVGKLIGEGIEAYHVDLVRFENRYYHFSGESHQEQTAFDHGIAANDFSSVQVQLAIRRSQAHE